MSDGIVKPKGFELTANPRVDRTRDFGARAARVVRPAAYARARREIPTWPGYAPTPLRELTGFARASGIGTIWYKDEGPRFGVGSFKPMGGGYAVARIVARHVARTFGLRDVTSRELLSGEYRGVASDITVTCATDGNHGRAVAWAARLFGCRAVIYMADVVSPAREHAMRAYGAEVVRSTGNHEIASEECTAAAKAHGWFIVSETERATEPDIAFDTLAGYRTLLEELFAQLPHDRSPTHMFIQAGVGGLAAVSCAFAADHWGGDRPVIVVVESMRADCIRRSLAAGSPQVVSGHMDTIMAGLAAGEVSGPAWSILETGADFGMAISDDAAIHAMRALADGTAPDAPVVGGESGVAGVAAVLAVREDAAARERLALSAESRVVTIGTEGATDADVYRRVVGRSPEDVITV